MMNEGISVADALALRNSGYNDGNSGWGDSGSWWIIIFLIFAFMGWGRNGFGNNGDGGNGGYNSCCTPATAQGVTDAFNFSQLDNGIRGLEQGICNGFYTQNNAINSVLSAIQGARYDLQGGMCQGFNSVNTNIMQSDFHSQAGFNSILSQMASCCCNLERGQEAIKCEVSSGLRDVMIENDKNTDRILNYLAKTENEKLRTELQSAQLQLSQLSQTSNIINQLMPVAKPAYITCSPYAAAMGYPYVNTGCGCGCNTGCGCA